MEALIHVMREELPDTAAAVRLSSLEVADAVGEVSSLGSDLTQGIRASARALVSAEQGVRQGVDLAGKAVHVSVKRGAPAARDALQSALTERAELRHADPAIHQVTGATKVAVQRLRMALQGASIAGVALGTAGRLRGRQQRARQPSLDAAMEGM